MKYKSEISLEFAPMSVSFCNELILNVKSVQVCNCYVTKGFSIDDKQLGDADRSRWQDGGLLVQYISYWSEIISKIKTRDCPTHFSSWYDSKSGKLYENSFENCLYFMLDSMLWENNMMNLLYLWSDKYSTFHDFESSLKKRGVKTEINGMFLPIESGIIGSMDKESFEFVRCYFE